MALRRSPTTRRGWAAFYDLRAARGDNTQADTLANWYLILAAAFGD